MEILKLIPKVMKSIGAVEKDKKNTLQKYNFRGIDDLYNAVQPALIEHGVFICPNVTSFKSETKELKEKTITKVSLTVKFTFYASSDGSSFDCTTVGEAFDYSDKAANKAMSFAMKYAFMQTFCIPIAGKDEGDFDSPSFGDYKPKTFNEIKMAQSNDDGSSDILFT